MNFNFYLLKSFRILLFPFSLIFGLIVVVRNYLFDKNILHSVSFNLPIIGIGNLSVGGTGKSPMVEYLISLLQSKFRIATVSRGYKRKTKGYALAHAETTALEIGDEPMQFHQKFPNIAVAVGEERVEAIPQLLHDRPETEIILLDDSFQHRKIKPGLNILLTECSNLYTRDFFLPTGDLRDQHSSSRRADIIVVTKCPAQLSEKEMSKTRKELSLNPNQQVFFTTIKYEEPYHILTKEKRSISHDDEILLVCGIANPDPLKKYLVDTCRTYYQMSFSDHHIYNIDDLNEIQKKFHDLQADKKIIITTEKDAVRLLKFNDILMQMPLYVLPVKHCFLSGGTQFDEIVHNFIKTFSRANI